MNKRTKVLCSLFGHKADNIKSCFNNDGHADPKKDWETFTATCKRCGCNLVAIKQFGEHSQEMVMSRFTTTTP